MSREDKLKELNRLKKLQEKKRLTTALAKKQATPKGRESTEFGKAVDTQFKNAFGSLVGGLQQLMAKDIQMLEDKFGTGKARGPIESVERQLAREGEERAKSSRESYARSPTGAFLGDIIGGGVFTAPLAAVPGLGQMGMAKKIADLMKSTSGFAALGRIGLATGRGAAEGAAAAGAQYMPEGQSRAQEALGGALWGGLPAAGIAGGAEAINRFRPSSVAGRDISERQKQEIAKNMIAAQGTKTSLGQVLGSPRLNNYFENFLAKLPASGALQLEDLAAEQTREMANRLFSGATKNAKPGEEATKYLKGALQGVTKDAQKMKRENYAGIDKMSTEQGIEVGREHARKTAKNDISEIDESEELADLVPSKIKRLLNKTATRTKKGPLKTIETQVPSKVLDASGKPVMKKEMISEHERVPYTGTLKSTNIYKGVLGDEARKYYNADDTYLGKTMEELNKAFKLDIEDAINTQGTPELMSEWRRAEKFYEETIVPLQDPDIKKFGSPKSNADADTIVKSFVKKDRPALMQKITEQLAKTKNPEEAMDTFRYEIFKDAQGKNGLNPTLLASEFEKYNDAQKRMIFSGKEELIPEMENLSRLTQMNKQGLYGMFNPKTGYQGTMKHGLAGAPYAWGHGPYNWITRAHANEKIREGMVNKILNPKNIAQNEYLEALRSNFTRGLAATSTEKEPGPYKMKITGKDVEEAQKK